MDVEAYILIGGLSSRLGTDKAFVRFGERTLAERSLNTVRRSNIASNVTFVAGNSSQLAIHAIELNAPFIFDLVEGRGPIGGIHAALSYAQTPWIFAIACDYPMITPEFLQFFAGTVSDEFGAVVPEQPDGRLQPLCAFYKVQTSFPIVDEIIHAKRVAPPMHEIVKKLDPRIVRLDEYLHISKSDDVFLNINTLSDLEAIHKNERKLSGELEI